MRKLLYKSLLVFLMVLCYEGVSAQNKTISGVITDNANLPIPSVIVKEKGTKQETLTDENGAFKISVKEGATIIISSIGFKTTELKAVDGMQVKLASATNELEGVTVTALGQTKKNKAIGYATSIIKADAITKTASPTIANSLYGKAPGVRITSTPGGAGAINIQIRGINSITGRNQPLIILDGVPIRDGEVNNNDYWNQQRIKNNGLADINPEDIENISILKGASAAALYGSEAVNGVVLITSKTGKGKKGLGVDFNTSYSGNEIAYLPRFQYERGPGWANPSFSSGYLAPDGFAHYPDSTVRGVSNSGNNYGPWFDGQPVLSWDGVVRPYSAQKDGYKNMFQNAWDATTNIALTNNTENSSTRFSYTHIESEGLSMGNNNKKNNFNLNASFKTGKLKTDVIVSYMNQNITNRTFAMDRLVNNFTGMLSPFDNGDWYKAKYKTSLGYKYVTGEKTQSLTPGENIYRNGFRSDIADYFFYSYAKRQTEVTNRLIASVTETLSITKDLSLRGRISTDLSSVNIENKNPVEIPLIYEFGNEGDRSGSFAMEGQDYNILYGDLLATYNKKINEDFGVNAVLGYSGSRETYRMLSRYTDGGLSVEGWYDPKSSIGIAKSDSRREETVKDAIFGTLSGSFRNYLFIEGTIRRDRTSTMNPDNNAFTYPSVNTSFVLSDAVTLPEFISYAKMRGSWGIVGNYPDRYRANVAFDQNTLGTQGTPKPVLITTSQFDKYGNEGIKPEMKNEFEVGFETKFFDRRLGLDFSYYNAKIKDQILDMTLAPTTGASKILANVGELSNKGFEIALTGSPFRTQDFSWDVTLNWAKNINKIVKLANGASELLHADYDGSAAQLKSVVGDPMGGIYAHPIKTDASGKKMVDSDGYYMLDGDKWEKYGSAMAKGVGGLLNSFTYKNFTLDVNIDYSYGGYLMPTGINWMTARGLTEESLNYSTNERGGLTYYNVFDSNGNRTGGVQVPNSATTGPAGQTLYRDGMLMDGVTADGTQNSNVVSQAGYYALTYNWGGPQYSSSRYELYIQKNDYVKLRELSLGFNVPASYASKIGATKLSLSFFGRNLFYIYRTIKDMDAEATTSASRWDKNVNNAGLTPSTRSYGVMLRASF